MEQIFKDFAEAISPALAQLVVALIGTLTAMAIGWLRQKWNNEKAYLSQTTQYLLEFAAQNGVQSAQQIYGAAKEMNKEKLDHAFAVVSATMKQWGFDIDAQVIYAAIESRVGLNKSKE